MKIFFPNVRRTIGQPAANRPAAFTLVEIIVVLFIVSVGLIGVLSLIVQNIQSQSYNKSMLVGYQIAQEGIELIRKTRDSNWKAGRPFNTGLADGVYYMDYLDSVPTPAVANSDVFILKQDTNGFYHNDPLSPNPSSGFTRQLTLTNIGTNSLRVVVTIGWTERQRDYTYDLETILYDWR
jgi:type II secretory pathway pseudopilin PulG